MKASNRSAVLKLLLQNGPLTRQRIANALNLTPATITNATRELITLGLVREEGDPRTAQTTTRRSIPLSIAADGSYAIGLNVGFTGLRIGVADLAGRVRKSKAGFLYQDRTAVRIVEQIAAAVATVVDESKVDPARIAGIGVAVAGHVDAQHGIVHSHLGLGWHGVPLGELLTQALERPVKLVNNVHAITLAERMYGAATALDDFALIYLSTIIGAGFVIGGQLYQGHASAAGMLAHLCVLPDGPLCSCGQRGCLEAIAGNQAVLDDARRALASGRESALAGLLKINAMSQGIMTQGMQLLSTSAHQGDKLACELLSRQAHYIGLGAAAIFNLFDPMRIVLITPGFRPAYETLLGARF